MSVVSRIQGIPLTTLTLRDVGNVAGVLGLDLAASTHVYMYVRVKVLNTNACAA